MNPFRKDAALWVGGVEMRVVRQIGSFDVQLENANTGELFTHKVFNLLQQYASGELLTACQRRHALVTVGPRSRSPARMDRMSPAAKSETRRRMDYLVRLQNAGSFEKSRAELESDLKVLSAVKGDNRPPHISTIYRWRSKYLLAHRDVRALFCQFDKQGGKGQSRLHPTVEGIIVDKIEMIFLATKRCSAEEVHNAVLLEIRKCNTDRVQSEWLVVPGLRTIQRRIATLYAFELAVARYGKKEAERRFANCSGARPTARILELVEIDHTPVDILVTNDQGLVMGRPWFTVVLDRQSRCVLGYYLSLAGHGTEAVFSALRHALLPKTYLRTTYADLQLEWDCYGWFETLLMDNGAEFHAESVADALMNVSIPTELARSRTPNDKPFVERFLRTFNYCFIHRLPGTTLAKVADRIGFKAEDEACITLAELDRLIHVWICSIYHVKRNAGLNRRAPIEVWKEGAAVHPPQLKENCEDLDIAFSRCGVSALQHYGIDLNTFLFVSPRLLTLRRMLPEGSTVDVKWPFHDAGHIFVWDPIQQEYFKVPNKDQQYASLTVEQAKAAKKAKAVADPSSQLAVASAQAVVRGMVKALLESKELKNRRKGTKLDNQSSNELRHPHAAMPEVPLDCQGTDIERAETSDEDLETLVIEMDWAEPAQ